VFTIEGPPAEPSTRGRNAAAIIIPVVLIALIVALSVVFLTGAVKLGKPAVGSISLASRVSSSNRPLDSRARFTSDDAAIYCCASVRAFGATRLEARWYQAGAQMADFKGTFGAMAGTPPAKFLTARGNVAFKLERPKEGWVGGPYSVKVLVNGKAAGERAFMVSEAATAGVAGVRYNDPAGGFSIMVPEGWVAADKSTLGGGLAGFIAPAGQSPYPPRFAVSLTDFTSVDPAYLNEIIKKAGAKDEQLFGPYSIMDLAGARRTFDWDFQSGGQNFRLRTIQVVVQTGDKIYSIDCHSLVTEFPSNASTFNAVINSFR
jgi:hypothetical protein